MGFTVIARLGCGDISRGLVDHHHCGSWLACLAVAAHSDSTRGTPASRDTEQVGHRFQIWVRSCLPG